MSALSLQDIIYNNSPFWYGEYMVAHKYFSVVPRSREKDIAWIRLQVYKEWTGSGVYPDRSITSLVGSARDALELIEAGGECDEDRVGYLLRFALDEFNHYKILSQAYHLLCPDRRESIFCFGSVEEAASLERLREDVRKDGCYGSEIVALTEGGALECIMVLGMLLMLLASMIDLMS